MSRRPILFIPLLLLLSFVACNPSDDARPVPAAPEPSSLAGEWRGVLESPGGDLPFGIRIEDGADGLEGEVVNGGEALPLSGVRQEGRQVVLEFAWYDSEITAQLEDDGATLRGGWRKTVPGGDSQLPFVATRGAAQRFLPPREAGLEGGDAQALPEVSGIWAVEFQDESGSEAARGEFRQSGEKVEGTFLTPTGDYRFLEGSYQDGLLRLSTFDGAHAFLFQARAIEGGNLAGDFWSRDSYHATFTARRVESEAEAPLPDAWSLAGLTNDEGRFSFEFPDLEGRPVSLSDERFQGKVVLVNIFGSWCPNCNDEAPL
ncbi:MAG: TlpA family protein disulfide reductase, partial [Acidobacteria bacterium]|nr:TlpA family protein disulfide reductase [Acidobacteriota bacterium]